MAMLGCTQDAIHFQLSREELAQAKNDDKKGEEHKAELVQDSEESGGIKSWTDLFTLIGIIFGIIAVLISQTWPWINSKIEGRSISKNLGAEFPKGYVERSLRYYIRPFCQDIDPSGGEEARLVVSVQQKLFEIFDRILTHPTEYNFIILLADSGMGKTSALLNYYARHNRRQIWRKKFTLKLIPLGIQNADERIAAVPNKSDTILFLDAFDEDTLAIVDRVERLRMILKVTNDFQRVLISCRTQFFSRDEEIPRETGKIKVGARAAGEPAEYVFHKIYLSPFTDKQVRSYIRRRFKLWSFRRRRLAYEMAEKIPHLTARPMLLAHIDDLVQAKKPIQYSFQLYEEMVSAWLHREKGFIQSEYLLLRFSEQLAVDLYINRGKRGAERVPRSELTKLAIEWRIPLDDWQLSARSLLNRDADGNYKFAHRSIMEYLFVNRFLDGDERCIRVPWTDQMKTFLWEVLLFHSLNDMFDYGFILDKYSEQHIGAVTDILSTSAISGLQSISSALTPSEYEGITRIIVNLCAIMLSPNKLSDSRISLLDVSDIIAKHEYTDVAIHWQKTVQDLPFQEWQTVKPHIPDYVITYRNENLVEEAKAGRPWSIYIPSNENGNLFYLLIVESTLEGEIQQFQKNYSSIMRNIISLTPRRPKTH